MLCTEGKDMIKILFVCLGNICRSPMAEFILRDMAEKAGISNNFEIASAATSREELGNPVYPPAAAVLRARGIDCSKKRARQITAADYDYFDYIIGMDNSNMRNMERVFGKSHPSKLYKMMSFADTDSDVADPWYTGDFSATERDIEKACRGLLQKTMQEIDLSKVQLNYT